MKNSISTNADSFDPRINLGENHNSQNQQESIWPPPIQCEQQTAHTRKRIVVTEKNISDFWVCFGIPVGSFVIAYFVTFYLMFSQYLFKMVSIAGIIYLTSIAFKCRLSNPSQFYGLCVGLLLTGGALCVLFYYAAIIP